MKRRAKIRNRLLDRARDGFHGYPLATVAYYGPNDQTATKVSVGIFRYEGAKPEMHKWFTDKTDARMDESVTDEIIQLLRKERVASVAAAGKIIGCPHEEGKDYPDGQHCPQCPFWAGKDRWEGIEMGE
jgi:hypothetical protein